MKVEFSDEAKTQVAAIDRWWRENRRAAPDLFTDELDQAILALGSAPGMGLAYEPKPGVRRRLLRRTAYHLYFTEDQDRVLVAAVWSAHRGQGPFG